MKKPLAARLVPLAVLTATLLSSCIYVRVKGDLTEAAWMEDVISDNHAAPASFHHGDPKFSLDGFLWSHEGRLKMDFYCAEEDLSAYAQSVRDRVEEKLRDEGYQIASQRQIDDNAWEYEYRQGTDGGRVTIEITERDADSGYPYRVQLRWTEI